MPNVPPRGTSRTPPPRSIDRSHESEANEKENRKRPHDRAEFCKSYGSTAAAAAPGSVGGGWHITTNSRCIVCRRLGDSCECRSTRMDPQLKRLKIDNFLQSTPHARSKQAKVLEETGRDEARHRNRLMEQWADGMKTMQNAASTCWRLLLLAHDESTAREFVSASERKEWAQGISLADRSVALVCAAQHEREARLLYYTFVKRQMQVLMDWHTTVMDFLVLLNREDAYRNALISQEAAARAALESRDEEFLNIMDAKERARRSMRASFLEQRDFIMAEWRRGVDAIIDAMADSERDISSKLMDRCRLCTECEQQKQHMRVAEIEERRQLRDAMAEKGLLVAEAVRHFARQRDDVARHEASARVGLLDEVTSAYSALFLARKREEEEVRDVEELKRQRRESEQCAALRHLSSIAQEEAAAFAAILLLERREKDQRYRRMLEMAARLRELEHTCANAYESLRDAEQRERHALHCAAQESEAAVGAWLQHCVRRLRELVALAAEEDRAIRAAEHEARFALIGHAAAHEEHSRRREKERHARIAAAESEAAERRASLLRMALAACAALAAEEDKARFALMGLLVEDRALAAGAALHRAAADAMRAEAEHRALVAQAEVRHREGAATQMLLERAVLEREAREALATQLCACAASEQRQRELLAHAAREALELLCRAACAAAAEAQGREERRRTEALRRRTEALAEDSRLYDAAEPLRGGSASAPRDEDGAPLRLQRALVLQALGAADPSVAVQAAAALSHTAVAFLARVVDAVAQRGAAARAERSRAQSAAEDAERRAAAQRQALDSAKERRQEVKEKIERDAAEHKARVASDRVARLRDDEQLETERARLQEKVGKLCAIKKEIADVREAIHSQHKKR